MKRIVNRSLRKDPARRFQSMKDLKIDLDELKAALEKASEVGPIPRPVRLRRTIRLVLGAVLTMVVAGAGAGVQWWLTRPGTFGQLPVGWFPAGSNPKHYEMGLDATVAHDGHGSAFIKSMSRKPRGFGTLMQEFRADQYRGKRLRSQRNKELGEVQSRGRCARDRLRYCLRISTGGARKSLGGRHIV